MLTFVTRRLLLAVPVLLGVVFVVMLTIDLLPGDAVTLMLGEHATRDAVANLRAHLGLDKPFLVRYLDYVGQLLRGDSGDRSSRIGPSPPSCPTRGRRRSSSRSPRCSSPPWWASS